MTDQTQQAAMEREAFEAWKVDQPWYIVSADDKDDPERGTTHRLMNIAAWTAWEASSKRAAFDTAAPAVGAPVATSGVLPLPVGIPTYDRFGNQTKAHFTADQMHEYAARCMLHALAPQPAAISGSLEAVQRDAQRYRWIRYRTSAHGVIDGWAFGFPKHRSLPAPVEAMRDPANGLDITIDAAIAAAPQKGEA